MAVDDYELRSRSLEGLGLAENSQLTNHFSIFGLAFDPQKTDFGKKFLDRHINTWDLGEMLILEVMRYGFPCGKWCSMITGQPGTLICKALWSGKG